VPIYPILLLNPFHKEYSCNGVGEDPNPLYGLLGLSFQYYPSVIPVKTISTNYLIFPSVPNLPISGIIFNFFAADLTMRATCNSSNLGSTIIAIIIRCTLVYHNFPSATNVGML
jgi:hypothetical protein